MSDSELQARISRLSTEQKLLLERRLSASRRSTGADERVQPQARTGDEDAFPLSFAQERLWALEQLNPGRTTHSMPVVALDLRGPLDVDALRDAWSALVERHETLRTRFRTELDGRALQVIGPAGSNPLERLDVQTCPAHERAATLRQTAQEEARRPFDLEREYGFRARLLGFASDHHGLLIAQHHMVSDGWSGKVLRRELAQLYALRLGAEPAHLPPLPIQYADFAVWQRRVLGGDRIDADLAYWRATLADPPGRPRLPLDRRHPSRRSFAGARVQRILPRSIVDAVRELQRRCSATSYMVLLSAFQVLVMRYADVEDIVVGSPVASRDRPEIEGIIGFFVNMLVIRCRLDGNPSFRELVGRTRRAALEAHAHQRVPFERLVEDLRPERDLASHPLFDISFAVHDDPAVDLRLAGLDVQVFEPAKETAKFDLACSLVEVPEGLRATLEYNLDVFDERTISRMLEHYETLLASALRDPDRRIWDLPLEERPQPGVPPGVRTQDVARAGDLAGRFETTVLRSPDGVAIVDGARSVRYRELDLGAERVANALRLRGMAPETRIGVCIEPSAELIVAILGVLKAGGAYVPLDPKLPHARLCLLASDAGLRTVLCTEDMRPLLPDGVVGLDLESLEDGTAVEAAARPGGDALAYVIYTSGSTGTPKGVAVSHHNVLRLMDRTEALFGFRSSDTWTLFHSISFDFSVWELWGALLYGGRIVIVPRELRRDTARFASLLERESVSVLCLTPSAFRQLIDEEARKSPAAPLLKLEWVILGGEPFHPAVLEPWLARYGLGRPKIVNMYGITETTVHVTHHLVAASDVFASPHGTPIGKPIDDLCLSVRDRCMRCLPVGVVGELCVSGPGLARGYLGRPGATAQRFVADPEALSPGERVYRSGDLGRLREDGSFEHWGRADQQVQVRGHRVELGEIEAALRSHAFVRDAVAIFSEERNGHGRVHAFCVGKGSPAPRARELRRHISAQLPEYMLPATIRVIDRIPLTQNGKLDVAALSRVDAGNASELDDSLVAPRTPAEIALAKIWMELLGRDQIGIHENFFELGGDSILAIQMAVRARVRGLSLRPGQVFEHQCVADLALAIGEEAGVHREPMPESGPIPLLPIQRWFLDAPDGPSSHFNQSVLLEVDPDVSLERLRAALVDLVRRNDALRLRLRRSAEGAWEQWVADDVDGVVCSLDLSSIPADERQRAVEVSARHAQRSLDLHCGPLFRAVIFELAGSRPCFVFVLGHHMTVDAVSWRLLHEELRAKLADFEAAAAMRPSSAGRTFREVAWSWWRYLTRESLATEVEFWQARSIRAPEHILDPGPAEAEDESCARSWTQRIDTDLTAWIVGDGSRFFGVGPGDLLTTCLCVAIARWAGITDVAIDVEGHGRRGPHPSLDAEGTIGWFTAIHPARFEVSRDDGGIEWFAVLARSAAAQAQHAWSYGWLRYGGGSWRRIQVSWEPEVRFNYLGQYSAADLAARYIRPAARQPGGNRSSSLRRRHPLEVVARSWEGRLQIEWRYGARRLEPEAIERLASEFVRVLTAVKSDSDRLAQRSWPRPLETARSQGFAVDEVLPLTPMQRALLVHVLSDGPGDVYVNQVFIDLRGELDLSALRAAWDGVVDRHPALRSSIVWEGLAEPSQRTHFLERPRLEVLDLEAETSGNGGRWEDLLRAHRKRSREISAPSSMSVTLVRVQPGQYRLVWTHHHVFLDGWSLANVLREIATLYEARVRGVPKSLPEPPPLSDFIAFQRKQDSSGIETYWRALLAGFEAPTQLSIERVRGAGRAPRHLSVPALALDHAARQRLEQFARAMHVTVNTIVTGALASILARYSGRCDVVFGTVVSGRSLDFAQIESMVGLFINTLPVRVRLEPAASIGMWLGALQAQLAELQASSHLPLAQVQRCSELPPGVSLFDSLLVFENYPVDPRLFARIGAGEHAFEVVGVSGIESTHYGLTFEVQERPSLRFRALYDGSRYEGRDVERLVEGWVRLVERLAGGEVERVGEWRLEGERKEESGYGQGSGVERLEGKFEEWAEREPGREAVLWSGRRVSYGELNARANEVARRLRARGIGVEDRVGVCVERSVGMVVSLLGVLKSGAAYVPLDAEYPAERLRWMVEDAAPLVMLSTGGVEGKLRGSGVGEGVEWIRVDEDGGVEGAGDEGLGGEEEERAETRRGCGESLAYVMYTSGSTGRPKGVGISHRSASALVEWALGEYRAEELSGVLAGTSICFDLSVYELFVPLSGGGRVIVAENVLGVGEVEERGEVTLVNSVPSAVQELLNQGRLPAGVRTVNLAGEPLRAGLVDRLYGESGIERVVDLYGPTEDTVYSTRAERSAGGDETIGSPIAGTQAYVMDGYGDPLPIGVVGELYLGGAGLARGYVNRAGATAAAFVPDAWGPRAGGRLYRTGDLARWREDGTLEYLGRADHQVKIRGYRIELSEIETILCQHPDVHEAAVLSENDAELPQRLVAYVRRRALDLEAETLRDFLGESLPRFMIPSVFRFVAEMPRTASGKLDRRALPLLARDEGGARPTTAERSELERRITAIWQSVLGVEQVGCRDNFFELGGDSLLATRVQRGLREQLGREIPLVELFEFSTIEALARHLERPEDTLLDEGSERKRELRSGRLRRERLRGRRLRDPDPQVDP